MNSTIEDRLVFLQKELYSITEEVKLLRKTSELKIRFNHGQKVFLIKGRGGDLSNLISSENTQVENVIEETTINRISIGDGSFLSTNKPEVIYSVNRYYEYQKDFRENELYSTKEELVESIREEFEEAKSLWVKSKEEEKIRKRERLERELRKLKEEEV